MKTQILAVLLGLIAVAIPAQFAFGDNSVWNSLKTSTYQVDGKITSIAFNEEQREMLVKVESAKEPGEVETVKVCSFKNKDDIQYVEQTEQMNKLREAFARGDRVQLSYNSRFDRCLSSINLKSSDKTDGKSI